MWRIESSRSKGTFYILQKLRDNCDCSLNCSVCNACPHLYSCTCLDSTVHSTVCKHSHFVHMESANTDQKTSVTQTLDHTKATSDDTIEENMDVDTGTTSDTTSQGYLLQLLTNEDPSGKDESALQSSIEDLAYKVITGAKTCSNADILQTIRKQMLSSISLLNCNATSTSSNSVSFEKTMQVAPNSNSVSQLRFRQQKIKNLAKSVGLSQHK